MSPFFTIIIPVYNAGDKLNIAVESVLCQTCDSYELIIIDDGSEDEETLGIINKYSTGHDNIRILRQGNKGVSAARNAGIREASGEYILMLDADDYLKDDILQKNKDLLDECGSRADILVRDMIVLDAKTGIKEKSSFIRDAGIYEGAEKEDFIKDFFKAGAYTNKGGCYRRSLINENHIMYNESWKICEDVDWNLRLLLRAGAVAATKDAGYVYVIYERKAGENPARYRAQAEASDYWSEQIWKESIKDGTKEEISERFISMFADFSVRIYDMATEYHKEAFGICKKYISILKRSKRLSRKVIYYLSRIIGAAHTMKIIHVIMSFGADGTNKVWA